MLSVNDEKRIEELKDQINQLKTDIKILSKIINGYHTKGLKTSEVIQMTTNIILRN